MKTFKVLLIGGIAAAAAIFFFASAVKGGNDGKVTTCLEELAGKVTELESKMNDMVAYQIKSSENNRQVYGAVAKLCTIFEGMLYMNSKGPEADADAGTGE